VINKKTKYALRAVQALALRIGEGPVLIADLAEKENIPKKFLEQILLDLKRAGILASAKGKGGGYSLAKAPGDISVGQIIRVIEGPLALVPCVSKQSPGLCEECKDPLTCGLRVVMKEARDQIASILDNASIQSLLRTEAELRLSQRESLNYVI
jgi:Rrf2 family protein